MTIVRTPEILEHDIRKKAEKEKEVIVTMKDPKAGENDVVEKVKKVMEDLVMTSAMILSEGREKEKKVKRKAVGVDRIPTVTQLGVEKEKRKEKRAEAKGITRIVTAIPKMNTEVGEGKRKKAKRVGVMLTRMMATVEDERRRDAEEGTAILAPGLTTPGRRAKEENTENTGSTGIEEETRAVEVEAEVVTGEE